MVLRVSVKTQRDIIINDFAYLSVSVSTFVSSAAVATADAESSAASIDRCFG